MTMGPENLGNGGAATQERFSGQIGYRGGRREADPMVAEGDMSPRNGAAPGLDGTMPLATAVRSSLADLDALAEPVLPTGWLDGSSGTLADHPLLRGLLLELPPKGTVPAPGWLDRWFEAARSILELLYVQEAQRR
jgi:hypothetical protein